VSAEFCNTHISADGTYVHMTVTTMLLSG